MSSEVNVMIGIGVTDPQPPEGFEACVAKEIESYAAGCPEELSTGANLSPILIGPKGDMRVLAGCFKGWHSEHIEILGRRLSESLKTWTMVAYFWEETCRSGVKQFYRGREWG